LSTGDDGWADADPSVISRSEIASVVELRIVVFIFSSEQESQPPGHTTKQTLEIVAQPELHDFGFCERLREVSERRLYSRYWLNDPTSKRTALVTLKTSQEKRSDYVSAFFQSLAKLISTPK
jgi:hypothetical protein